MDAERLPTTRLCYTAAHADFPDTEPLGGGKAVADYLIRHWRATPPFDLNVLSPRSTGANAHASLANLSEWEYARFCRTFERAVTTAILQHDPATTVVLSNDISEGPDFAALAQRGYKIVTIFHVDVVEYFTKFYLRGLVRPERLTQFTSFRWLPDVLQLVFQKQLDCVRHSQRLVVPSSPMRETILRCYPWCPAERVVVLPWGNVAEPVAAPATPTPFAESDFVILTLSRLSPEKGIERLLAALHLVPAPCRVVVAGAAAYMSGRRYERKLRRLADRRVEFWGHVTGARKAGLLHRADVFVSPSRHESYGLTIAEAEAAGCRILSHAHYGARGTVMDCGDPVALAAKLNEWIASGRTVKQASSPVPSSAATELAELLARVRRGHD